MPHIITPDHLSAIAGKPTPLMPGLADWINQLCPTYEIDSPQEYSHFLAQACHETDHFKTLKEYASGKAYESRVDLGNNQLGDGVRFKGRGIFQTTGRANYLQLGIKKGRRDLFINKPELLEQPEYAVWSACEYWKTRNLNDIANHADDDILKKKYRGRVIDVSPIEFISITINGGYNGMADRKKFYEIAKNSLPMHK
ncbi:MAG TPA: glycoside hydrolase [Accumulibacter sp.]|uniref:glycoside hydrolase family 19 protein n=1 Tax=Accumulibacter sp. TaxID=2053492 RepID=UPI002B88FBD1|nr:glycoside hydrolase [Accumulibacter sp.]HMW19169.1 glycoside hydrolase [Accumulibacter sp.]HMX23222.1 glycoside hydrolase [Accumulibacter sp.]HMY07236.1 glycoside hydrolase [Accumulibacter sp.]HNC20254.1 glycoside hydrolase [Accumulibacter sp.]HNG39894.1 glycoside hydrolase [Accumulibacter sp.]